EGRRNSGRQHEGTHLRREPVQAGEQSIDIVVVVESVRIDPQSARGISPYVDAASRKERRDLLAADILDSDDAGAKGWVARSHDGHASRFHSLDAASGEVLDP